MSIAKFYTTTISITRMEWSNDSSAEGIVEDFSGHIQQAGPEFTENIGEAWGKTFIVWCPKGTNIEPGDTIAIEDGDYIGEYSVRNVQMNATGANQHKEVTVVKDIAE